MTIRLERSDYDIVVDHIEVGSPNEICGLIVGII